MNEQQTQDLIAKYRDKSGLKGKIIAKCIECAYDPLGKGTWRKQVQECGCPSCPLYSVRPVSSYVSGDAEAEDADQI